MGIERYIAIAGVGLYIMFVAEINVLYNFLNDPFQYIEPVPKVLQFISISIAPASILVAVSYILSRRYGSKFVGTLMIIGGVALILGMAHAYTLLDDIEPKFLEPAIEITPIVFAIIGIPITLIGVLLLRDKKPRKNSSLDFSSWSQSED